MKKKQTFTFDELSIQMLETIAKKNKRSKSNMLEVLIKKEHELSQKKSSENK